MLNLPVLDDQRFEDIVTEAKKRIPQLCAEWTDFNEHDPGITLIELFAWYKQMQQYHLDQITADHLRMFLKLMGIVPEPVRETRANLLAAGKGIQEPSSAASAFIRRAASSLNWRSPGIQGMCGCAPPMQGETNGPTTSRAF